MDWLLEQLEALYTREADVIVARVKAFQQYLHQRLTQEFDRSTSEGTWSADDPQFRERMSRLNDALAFALIVMLDEVREQMLRYELAAYRMGYYGTAWDIRATTLPMVADDTLRTVLSGPFADATLAQRLYDVRMDTEARARRAWTLSQTEGETLTQALRRTDSLIGVAAGAVVGTSLLHRIGTVVESEFWRAANAGTEAMLRANTKILLGKAWFTRKDERVCKRCGRLHGTVIPLDEKFEDTIGNVSVKHPPLHPLCRCWTIGTRTPVYDDSDPRDYYDDWAHAHQIEMAMDGRNLL